jgi:hypothetical protein
VWGTIYLLNSISYEILRYSVKLSKKSGILPEAGFGGDECVAAESHFQIH